MNREEIEKLIEEVSREAGGKRKGPSIDAVRKVLNVVFMLLAIVGLVFYFVYPENRVVGLGIIGVGMVFKVVEFFLRFLF